MVRSFSRASVMVILTLTITPQTQAKNIFDGAHGILKPAHLSAKAARKTLDFVEPLVPSSEAQLGIKISKGALKVAESGLRVLDSGAQKLSKRHQNKPKKKNSTAKSTQSESPKAVEQRIQHVREARLKHFLGEEPPQAKTLSGRIKAEFKRKFAFFFPPKGNPHTMQPWKDPKGAKVTEEKHPRIMTLADLKARERGRRHARAHL